MIFDWLSLVLVAWLGHVDPAGRGYAAALFPEITFRPRDRAVSNWRSEAALHLEATYGVTAKILLGHEPPEVTRCVRLNNYWCIKRAGWAGEIAADGEGHVAFASAAEGADVAALLLRRYYMDYGRHTALAIISHWAPASCGAAGVGSGRSAAPALRAAADHLAVHGLGHTLRARFLAGRGGRVARRGRLKPHRSIVPDALIGAGMRAPAIAVGLGEKPLDLGSQTLSSIPLAALGPAAAARTGSAGGFCPGEGARIQSYAAKAASGVAPGATDDLKLFDADGRPTPNLAQVMHNMSAVEIGPLGADRRLIAAAIAHMATMARPASPAPPPRAAPAPPARVAPKIPGGPTTRQKAERAGDLL